MSEPSPAEMMRRIEELLAEVKDVKRTIETTYTRSDVYAAQRAGDRAEVRALREDLDIIAAQRRQLVMLALSGLLLPVIVSIVVALVLGGGSTQ